MSITIKDIAKIAGVSHSTVSRSLNNSPLISQETREKIHNIARDLGFEFNANARGLSTRKTGTIGLVYPEVFENFNINLFFGTLQSHIRQTLEREGLDVIVTFPKNRFSGESNIQKLISRKKVDGLIIVHTSIDRSDLNYIRESQIPHVFLHHKPLSNIVEGSDFFYTDHFKGGYMAAKHLIRLGHRNIMCVRAGGEEFEARTEGFRAALEDSAVPFDLKFLLYGDCTFEWGNRFAAENTEIIKQVSGVFVQADLMALGMIQGLKQKGIDVPGNVAVIGYDDIELDTYFSPSLTTIHQPREEIASLASERLMELLKSKKKKSSVKKAIQPTLIVRESCGGLTNREK